MLRQHTTRSDFDYLRLNSIMKRMHANETSGILKQKTHFSQKNFCSLQGNRIFVYNFGIVMTDEEKKRLSTFEARLRHLIFLHDELKRENAELKQLLQAEQEERKRANAAYRALEIDYTNLKTAMTISLNGSDVNDTKLRLSKLVREVDKCIALLNE